MASRRYSHAVKGIAVVAVIGHVLSDDEMVFRLNGGLDIITGEDMAKNGDGNAERLCETFLEGRDLEPAPENRRQGRDTLQHLRSPQRLRDRKRR